jgi:hypothetical protein
VPRVLVAEKVLPSPSGAIRILFKAFSPFSKLTPVRPDIVLSEADRVGKLTVIHTPGHTREEAVLRWRYIRFANGRITGPPKQFTLDTYEALQSIAETSKVDLRVGHEESCHHLSC